MSLLTHTVTVAEHFTVTGAVNTDTPEDLNLDLSKVDLTRFTDAEAQRLVMAAADQLDEHFDQLLGVTRDHGSDEPIPGLIVNQHGEHVTVTNTSDGAWTMLGSAELADATINASLLRINAACTDGHAAVGPAAHPSFVASPPAATSPRSV